VYSLRSRKPEHNRIQWTGRRSSSFQRTKHSGLVPNDLSSAHIPGYSYRCLSQTSIYETGSLAREISLLDDQKNERRRLLDALEMGQDEYTQNQLKRTKECRVMVRHTHDETTAMVRSCGGRWCPHCSRKQIIKRTNEVANTFANLTMKYPPHKFYWGFITLTVDDERLGCLPHEVEPKVKAVRKELTRIMNQRWIKANIAGSLHKIENKFTTSGPNRHRSNLHLHMVVISKTGWSGLHHWFQENWRLGSIQDVRKWKFEDASSVYEICKGVSSYLAKQFSYETPFQLLQMIRAMRSVRLFGSTGCVRTELREVREEIEREKKENEPEEMPTPPKRPKVNDLPEGSYNKLQLLWKVFEGSETALYCLKVINYEMRCGHLRNKIGERPGEEQPPPGG